MSGLDRLVTCQSAFFFVRRLNERSSPIPKGNIEMVPGEGPFSVADEIETLTRLRIDVLVCKNAGGTTSRTKLDAARQLGLPVILIDRPVQPPGPYLTTSQDALSWVQAL